MLLLDRIYNAELKNIFSYY